MTWMAIRANEEEVRAALQGAGIEVIETGSGHSCLAQLVKPADAAFVARFAGETQQRTPASDKQLFMALLGMVTAQVSQAGGCILDLRECGLGADKAKAIAERAGLDVSIGLKAVYTPRPDTEVSAWEARTE